MSTTYSFKDVSGSLAHPLAGVFPFFGQVGVGQFAIEMMTEKSAHEVASDGAVMVSIIPGDNGHVSIEVQQTSLLNTYLQGWYNIVKTALNAGDVTNSTNMTLTLRSLVDGSVYNCKGGSPLKLPTKTYAKQGQMITWTVNFADIQVTTIGAA